MFISKKELIKNLSLIPLLVTSISCGQWYSKYGIKDDKELNSFRAVPKLMKALKSGNCYDGMRASGVLVSVGEQARSAFFDLEHFLKRSECTLRQRVPAAIALGQLGKPAFNILLRALISKNGKIRYLAVVALGAMKFKEPEVIILLNRKIASQDPLDLKYAAKQEAFVSLGKHGEKAYKSVPLLVKLLDEPQWRVLSMDALVAIGIPSRMALDALKSLAEKSTDEDFKNEVMRRYYALMSKTTKSREHQSK